LRPGDKEDGAHFNRFGIITTHIDGNGQTVYFDDLTYTVGFVPSRPGCAAAVVLILVGFSPRSIRGAARGSARQRPVATNSKHEARNPKQF